MMRMAIIAAALLASGCATRGHGVAAEVNAVVQDEQARQAAGIAATNGEGSKAALKAGAEAASPATTTPPR